MPKINLEVPADLHAQLKAHPDFSINQLVIRGIKLALRRYPPNLLDPDVDLEQVIGPVKQAPPTPSPSPTPASPTPSPVKPAAKGYAQPAKRISADPVGDALKPWSDSRKHVWYDLEGFMSFLGLERADIALYIDMEEDVDRSSDEREVLDRSAIERIFANMPGAKYHSMDRYHAVNAWLDAAVPEPA